MVFDGCVLDKAIRNKCPRLRLVVGYNKFFCVVFIELVEVKVMTISEILTFAFVASLLVVSPGPNGILIAKTVPTSGRRAGFANVAGFVTGFYLHGATAILGISAIMVQSSTVFTIVKYLGAAYLAWIGV